MVNVSFTYELHLFFLLSLDPSDEPVYEIPPAKYTARHIIKILLNPDESGVCCQKPISVTKSATYVVDVRKLPNQDDIKKDEFGIWKYSGSHPQAFKVYKWEDAHITVEKCSLITWCLWSKCSFLTSPPLYTSIKFGFQTSHLLSFR